MGVNFFTDKAGSQEMSVALSEGAQQLNFKNFQNSEDENKINDKSDIKKLLDTKESKEAGKQILTKLASKLSTSGIKLGENLLQKSDKFAKDELDMLLANRESTVDDVNLSTLMAIKSVKGKKSQTGQEGREGRQKGWEEPSIGPEIRETLVQYKQAYAALVVNGGDEIKKKVEQLELKLKNIGMSSSEILDASKTIKFQMRQQIAVQIKEALIKKLMSDNKSLDWAFNTKEFNEIASFAFHNDKLGGWDFGGYNGHLQGTVDEMRRAAESDIRLFVSSEYERALVSKHLGVETDEKAFNKLIDLGAKVGFDFQSFLNTWQTQKDNIGIIPVPQNPASALQGGSGFNQKRETTGYEFKQEDEKDLLTNQLRALYMQRAIKGDLRTIIETSFKIKKLENGLIKLGVKFEDFEQIKKEGTAIAKLKAMDMLREALCERGTLYELQGPAFILLESRIKGLLSNLERLGIYLSKIEFESLRDDANHKMFEVARDELERYHIINEVKPNPSIEKKILLLVKLMKRLKAESNIETAFDFNKYAALKASA